MSIQILVFPTQEKDKSHHLQNTYISWAHDTTDLLHRVEIRTQTAMHREDLLVDDGSDGQAVEAIGERLPQLDIVSSLALIVETIDTVD